MTTNRTVYFDEAGNTGAALLDEAQPVFVLSSLDYSDQEAEELLRCVASSQGAEAKFKNLKKRPNGQRKLIDFFTQPKFISDRGERVKTTVFHKQYMVASKMIDLLVEPLTHKDGLDLYERGGNIALANLLFGATPTFCGPDKFNHFLNLFVSMVHKKDKESVNKFFYWARRLHKWCADEKFKDILALFLVAERWIDDLMKGIDYLSIDPAIPSFFSHCAAWGEKYRAEFDVIHDESKPLCAERDNLRLFMDKTISPERVGYDRRTVELPLKAKDLGFGSSHNHRQLQVADLVASATAYMCTCRVQRAMDDFAQALEQEAQLDSLVIGAVLPSPYVTPAELETDQGGGDNALNFMADILSKRLSGKS